MNATAIGSQASADASNKVRIGNGSVTSIGGQVAWTNFSDGRIKKNIRENVPGLVFINLLKPVTYNISLAKEFELMGQNDTLNWAGKNDIEKISFSGLVAQDVEAAANKIGYDFSGVDKTGKIMGLRYSDFVVPLVKAVQELSKENTELKKQNDTAEKINTSQQKQIDELKTMLLALQQKVESCNPCAANYSAEQSSKNILLSGASLEQNIPNPFGYITTIHYTLPQQYVSAMIIITDKTGKSVKSVNISGSGKGSLKTDASALASGTYQYTLYVDGKLIDTKQMVLVK